MPSWWHQLDVQWYWPIILAYNIFLLSPRNHRGISGTQYTADPPIYDTLWTLSWSTAGLNQVAREKNPPHGCHVSHVPFRIYWALMQPILFSPQWLHANNNNRCEGDNNSWLSIPWMNSLLLSDLNTPCLHKLCIKINYHVTMGYHSHNNIIYSYKKYTGLCKFSLSHIT